MGTTDPVTLAAEQLAAARQAHAATIANHAAALDTAGRARDRHTAAAAQRERLLAAAADGASVDEDALKRADAAAADALNTRDLHRSIAAGAQVKEEQAEAALLRATVADHSARATSQQQKTIGQALRVDAAIAAARAELAQYSVEISALGALHSEVVAFNHHVIPEVLTRNSTLRGLHQSRHPKMQACPVAQVALSIVILANGRPGHLDGARIVPTLASYAAGLAPKTPTPPPAAPAPAAWATYTATPATRAA